MANNPHGARLPNKRPGDEIDREAGKKSRTGDPPRTPTLAAAGDPVGREAKREAADPPAGNPTVELSSSTLHTPAAADDGRTAEESAKAAAAHATGGGGPAPTTSALPPVSDRDRTIVARDDPDPRTTIRAAAGAAAAHDDDEEEKPHPLARPLNDYEKSEAKRTITAKAFGDVKAIDIGFTEVEIKRLIEKKIYKDKVGVDIMQPELDKLKPKFETMAAKPLKYLHELDKLKRMCRNIIVLRRTIDRKLTTQTGKQADANEKIEDALEDKVKDIGRKAKAAAAVIEKAKMEKEKIAKLRTRKD